MHVMAGPGSNRRRKHAAAGGALAGLVILIYEVVF
jgi:hypothetical protein